MADPGPYTPHAGDEDKPGDVMMIPLPGVPSSMSEDSSFDETDTSPARRAPDSAVVPERSFLDERERSVRRFADSSVPDGLIEDLRADSTTRQPVALSTRMFAGVRRRPAPGGGRGLPSVTQTRMATSELHQTGQDGRLMNNGIVTSRSSVQPENQQLLEGRFAASSLFFVKGVLSPNSSLRRVWNVIMFACVLYNTLLLPFYCSFRIVFTPSPPSFQFLFNYLCDILWVLDIALGFYTGFFEEGMLVTERRRVALRYLRGSFGVDIAAALPLDLAAFVIGVQWLPFLRLNKMLQFYRTGPYAKEFERNLRLNANVASLVRLLLTFVVFVHWCGCVFYLIGLLEHENGAPFVWQQDRVDLFSDDDNFTKWVTSVYWSLTCMTTVGFGDIVPVTATERQFAIFVELIGVSVYATAFGNMTALIQNMDFSATAFRRKVDTVTEYMKFRKLSPSLRKRVLSYYDVVWSRHKGLDESTILDDLPTSLKAEISLILNRDLVLQVPLFKNCHDPGFINSLVVMLVPVTALPGDHIVRCVGCVGAFFNYSRYGEIGREMYFVRRGQVNVMSKDGQTMFASLKDGMYFGEVALLEDVRRTASVRAATYCDLLVLSKADFERVLTFFPQYQELIKKTAHDLGSGYVRRYSTAAAAAAASME